MGDKSKAGKKKKHISKHVLKARDDKEAIATTASGHTDASPGETPVKTKRKQPKNRHVKDPSEAVTYLQQWRESQSGKGSGWKFNKNTQSWLIRHMYEADKVPKSVFTLLLEYLEGLEGKATKTWLCSDASRRALRYKNYEKDIKNDSHTKHEAAKVEETSKTQDEREEEARWIKLSDHDKRKEYKRARKILETAATS
jgi:WKF domain